MNILPVHHTIDMRDKIYNMDALSFLKCLPSDYVQTCVTSPPYYGLRDYGNDNQIGLEPTLQDYIKNLVDIFTELKRVLKPDGTFWLNLGDSFNSSGTSSSVRIETSTIGAFCADASSGSWKKTTKELKPKDLMLVPHRVAIALQDSGWWVRMDNVWHKPNPMPESVKDRPTKAHEYVFLLTKSDRYYYDADAVRENFLTKNVSHMKTNYTDKAVGGVGSVYGQIIPYEGKNRRSVWSINTKPYKEAHFAVMPPDIPELCIKAGSKPGDIVLDMFMGAGTVGLVAKQLDRYYIGSEINPDYIQIAEKRIATDWKANQLPLFA